MVTVVVSKQYVLYSTFAIFVMLFYVIGTQLLRGYQPWVPALVPIIVSIVGMAVIRWVVEQSRLNGMFNPRTQSWAFMFGDLFSLPVAMFCIAVARDKAELGSWADAPWWYLVAALCGLAAGVAFHAMDIQEYRSQGAELALESPTKIWHDFVVYPVLFGVLLWAGVPLLWSWPWSTWTMLAIAAIASWLVFGVVSDGNRGLSAYDMHPGWCKKHFRVKSRCSCS